ncbi:MAG TPA: divalent-cation tolerance protein CutA [Terriglobia bacterium]|nr:divalent-cation tolerance protein CutA [Terriglobia bacterium]
MTDKIVVFITARNMLESKKIARHLVQAELAACVNIIHPIRSIYRWQGKIEDDRECLLIAKSTRGLFREIEAEVKKVHSYKTPEILCLPVVDGSADYLGWIDDSVKRAGGAD